MERTEQIVHRRVAVERDDEPFDVATVEQVATFVVDTLITAVIGAAGVPGAKATMPPRTW